MLGALRDVIRGARLVGTRKNAANAAPSQVFVGAVNEGDQIVPVRITAINKNGRLEVEHVQRMAHRKKITPGLLNRGNSAFTRAGREQAAGDATGIGPTVRDLMPGVKQEADGTHSVDFSGGAPKTGIGTREWRHESGGGERPRPTTEGLRALLGRRAAMPLSKGEIEQWFRAVRAVFPELAQRFDIESGIVTDVLNQLIYDKKVAGEQAQRVWEASYQARMNNARAVIARLDGLKRLVALGAAEWTGMLEGAHFLAHEIGHAYFDTLSEGERAVARELFEKETKGRSGPLFNREGVKKVRARFLPEEFEARGMKREEAVERAFKEWFSERVALANRDWVDGRIARESGPFITRMAFRLREFLRRMARRIEEALGRDLDENDDVFEKRFRDYMLMSSRAEERMMERKERLKAEGL
jgi:hypothetical protein